MLCPEMRLLGAEILEPIVSLVHLSLGFLRLFLILRHLRSQVLRDVIVERADLITNTAQRPRVLESFKTIFELCHADHQRTKKRLWLNARLLDRGTIASSALRRVLVRVWRLHATINAALALLLDENPHFFTCADVEHF